jgi:hypothetical protein
MGVDSEQVFGGEPQRVGSFRWSMARRHRCGPYWASLPGNTVAAIALFPMLAHL